MAALVASIDTCLDSQETCRKFVAATFRTRQINFVIPYTAAVDQD